MKTLAASLLILLLLTQPGRAADLRNPAAGVGIQQRLGHRIPLDLTVQDAGNRVLRLGELVDGKPLVMALGYHHCRHLCDPLVTGIARSIDRTALVPGRDFDVAFLSIDPQEGPQEAASHRQRTLGGPRPGWHFLTGSPDTIQAVATALGFHYRPEEGSDQYAHAAGIEIIDPRGRIAAYQFGVDFDPQTLRLNLVRAGQGGIGSPVDALLLLCLHYDPASGRYNLAVSRAIRTAGLGTVLVLALSIGALTLRGRRRHPSGGGSDRDGD